MMQSADFGDLNHLSQLRRPHCSWPRRVLQERQRGADTMIIFNVVFQNPAGMIFIEHDHMIKALSPENSNYSFREGMLPGTPGRRDHFFDAHHLYSLRNSSP